MVHYVGGAEVRYAATASNGAGALKEVRRTAGNVLVVQDVSRGIYQLKRLTLLTDFQGSTHRVLSAMTQQPVAPVTSTSFDAWGKRRNGETWSEPAPWDTGLETWRRASTTHGYTGHEMAESVGVIHMNGRLYDPHFARLPRISGRPATSRRRQMVPLIRLERMTYRLQGGCSTN